MKDKIEFLRREPVQHVIQVQGVQTLEGYQKRIIDAAMTRPKVAVSACHDVGKTFTMSKLVLCEGSLYRCKIITTAPTHNQVEKLLWSEIRTGFKNSLVDLGGRMLTTEWKIDDDWFALGISPKDDAGQDTGSRFQGFHAPRLRIIFDEATGIHKNRWEQAEGMLTSHNSFMTVIGNPTSKSSEFFKCFTDPEWYCIKLSCFDSPNLIANGIVNMGELLNELHLLAALPQEERFRRLDFYQIVQPQLLTTRWVMGRALKWKPEHPLFQSRVLGEFPDEEDTVLISMRTVEEAQRRYSESTPEYVHTRAIGVDPARFGSDNTVITVIENETVVKRIEVSKRDTTEIVGIVMRIVRDSTRCHKERIAIDATGIGSGVVDRLKELKSEKILPEHIQVMELHFGSSPSDDYANLKARIFVELSEDLKTDLGLLTEDIYLEELPTIHYKFDSKGRYVIESKDEYKKRTGRGSPDSSDSLAIANYARRGQYGVGEFTEDFTQTKGADTITGNVWQTQY